MFPGDKTVVRRCESVFATYTQNGIIVDDVIYPFTGRKEDAVFIEDEECIAYMNNSQSKVIYIRKDYSSKDLLVVMGLEYTEDGVCTISTSKGNITITEEKVCIDGCYYLPEELKGAVDSFNSYPVMYYYKAENCQVFEQYCEPVEIQERFHYGIFGDYVFTDKTTTIVNGYEYGIFVNKYKPTQDGIYLAKVYSKDGVNIDIMLFDDPYGDMMRETAEMIVSDCTDNVVSGYSNGNPISILVSDEAIRKICPGDYITFSHTNGKIIDIEVFGPIKDHVNYGTVYTGNGYPIPNSNKTMFVAPVLNISNDLKNIYNEVNGTTFTSVINEDTYIYVFDMSDNTITPADITEITFYDWVFIRSRYSLANTVVIYRE